MHDLINEPQLPWLQTAKITCTSYVPKFWEKADAENLQYTYAMEDW